MARRHKVEEAEHEASHERWLLTYADMITLLMVLFIVLFALGQTDIRKFNAFRQSFHTASLQPSPILKGGTGVLAADNTLSVRPTPLRPIPSASILDVSPPDPQTVPSIERRLQAVLQGAGVANDVRFSTNASGLAVTVATDKILFTTGSADLLPLGVRIIDAVAPVLLALPNDLDIQGHTDDQPISGGPYPSNWELSTARATAVLHDLVDLGVAPPRLSASGYGDTRPIATNDTPTDRSLNRRVEIVILTHPIAS